MLNSIITTDFENVNCFELKTEIQIEARQETLYQTPPCTIDTPSSAFHGTDHNDFDLESQDLSSKVNSPISPNVIARRCSSDSMIGSTNIHPYSRSTSEPISHSSSFFLGKGYYSKHLHGYIRPNSGLFVNRRNILVTLIRRVQPENIRNSLNSLNRNSIRTFYCKICMENCSSQLCFCAEECKCLHEYCILCMSGYVSSQVHDGIIQFPCPGVADCNSNLTKNDLRMLLCDELYSRFERITQIKTNLYFRECPSCNGEYTSSEEHLRSNGPDIHCLCGCVYCFYHANAHPGTSCEIYVRTMSKHARDEMVASETVVRETSKPCPNCQAATEKSGGCNHMTCSVCKADWCWLCHRQINNPVDHYNPANIFGCPASQFADVAPMQYDQLLTNFGDTAVVVGLRMFLWGLFIVMCRLIPTIIVFIIGFVSYLAGSIILSPILLGFQLYRRKIEMATYGYVGLVFSVFNIVVLCGILDMLWIPILVAFQMVKMVFCTFEFNGLYSKICDQILLYSLTVSFLMLIDFDG